MIDWLTALAATTINTLINDMQYPHGLLFNSYQDYPIMNNIDEQIDIDVPSNTYESDLGI